MTGTQYAAACPKFEAANKLYKSAGILLNLGDCYEKTGQTVSSWTAFEEAISVAQRTDRPADVEEAQRRQIALEATLVRLAIRVSHAVPGLTVTRDGAVVSTYAWGKGLPVAPGTHEVRAEATGYEPWIASIAASTPGEIITVDVPELREAVAVMSPGPSAPTMTIDTTPSSTGTSEPRKATLSRTLGWALAGGGVVVGLAGTTLMATQAVRASHARDDHDPASYDAARTPWTIGLVAAIAGGVSSAGGVLLLTVAGRSRRTTGTGTSAWIGVGADGVRLAGTW